jgi:hypothetical protein
MWIMPLVLSMAGHVVSAQPIQRAPSEPEHASAHPDSATRAFVARARYYTFTLGDSAALTLPDGRRLVLRELRARPRRPKWNLSVGSYGFDRDRLQLVRAVYRLSAPYGVWTEVDNTLAKGEQGPPWYVTFLAQPLKGELQAVTLEYGLYENQFWLPRVRRVDGTVKAGPVQLAVTIEQGFRYGGGEYGGRGAHRSGGQSCPGRRPRYARQRPAPVVARSSHATDAR